MLIKYKCSCGAEMELNELADGYLGDVTLRTNEKEAAWIALHKPCTDIKQAGEAHPMMVRRIQKAKE